jgi:hypothetical protein
LDDKVFFSIWAFIFWHRHAVIDPATNQEKMGDFHKILTSRVWINGTEIVYEQEFPAFVESVSGQSQQLNITLAGDFHGAQNG